MKKFFLLTGLIIAFTLSGYAQFKVHPSGAISTGNVTNADGYNTHLYGYDHRFYQGGNYIHIQMMSGGSRISGNSDRIVFYSRLTNNHNRIEVKSVYEASDRKLKTNIVPVFNSLDKIKSLNAVSYNWLSDATKSASEGTEMPTQDIGFIAQDVEQILPEAVSEDTEGNKLINYRSLIPLLAESIKELSAQIEDLQAELEEIKSGGISNEITKSDFGAKLYQNTPNPTNGLTKIPYFVPKNAQNAQILILNLQGGLVSKKAINNFGDNEVTIAAGELKSGLYLYTLVVDNKSIGTKRMIVTN